MKKKIIIILILIILITIILLIGMKLYVNYHKKEFQIPVLMYHDIILDEYYQDKPDTISLSMFEKQLKYLKDNNYKTLTLEEFYNWKTNNKDIPKKSILLTFDDGFYSFHYLVEPLLEKYNMHAACFIIGKYTKVKEQEYNPNKYGTIDQNEIINHSEYVEYGSHSYNLHKLVNGKKIITTISEEKLEKDFIKMQDIYSFEYFSYPFNTNTNTAIKLLKKYNYKLAFRGEGEKTTKNNNNYLIPRIGMENNIEKLEKILETDYYNNRYGHGIIRRIFIKLERKIGKRIFKWYL